MASSYSGMLWFSIGTGARRGHIRHGMGTYVMNTGVIGITYVVRLSVVAAVEERLCMNQVEFGRLNAVLNSWCSCSPIQGDNTRHTIPLQKYPILTFNLRNAQSSFNAMESWC
jgi:hypothetical protein